MQGKCWSWISVVWIRNVRNESVEPPPYNLEELRWTFLAHFLAKHQMFMNFDTRMKKSISGNESRNELRQHLNLISVLKINHSQHRLTTLIVAKIQFFQLQLLSNRTDLCQNLRWFIGEHLFLNDGNLKSKNGFFSPSSSTLLTNHNWTYLPSVFQFANRSGRLLLFLRITCCCCSQMFPH